MQQKLCRACDRGTAGPEALPGGRGEALAKSGFELGPDGKQVAGPPTDKAGTHSTALLRAQDGQ